MSDLKYTQLLLAKFEAMVAQAGFDTSGIDNQVAIMDPSTTGVSFGHAGATNDFIYTNEGGDVYGYGGDDLFMGGSAHNTFHGGTGDNTVAYTNAGSGITLFMDASATTSNFVNTGDAKGDVLDHIQNVVGTNFNDMIYGDDHNNRIYGGGGDDVLVGGAGIDKLYGGDGNDTLFAGKSDGSLETLDPSGAREELHGDAGNDTLVAGINPDLLDGGAVDSLHPLTFGNVQFAGNLASYEMSTAGVNVNLATGHASGGYATGDVLEHIQGLVGSAYNDVLTGDSGNNVLEGGQGNDTLTGGGGNDTFYFKYSSIEGTNISLGHDTITDWHAGDTIQLDGISDLSKVHMTQLGQDAIVTVDGFAGTIDIQNTLVSAINVHH